MITVRANARNATYISNDLITSGSVGIPVTFNLSEDFDGLSAIAVFEGSGTARDVALIGDSCVVPHEVLTTAGGYLRIGIYASNSAGTIVIPTVWAGSKMILQGTEPSEVDPSEPTPSWVAQVQEAAVEALETAQSVEQRADSGEFDGEPGPAGPVGPQGETGNSGVYVGSEEPTDPDVNVWIDPNGSPYDFDAGAVAYDSENEYPGGSVGQGINDLKSALGDIGDGLYTICGNLVARNFEWIADSYVSETGVITPYNGWHRTDYMDIKGATKIYLYATSTSATQTYNCWFDANKTFISKFLCNASITEYTPPSGAKYFMLSTNNSNNVTQGVADYTVEKLTSNMGFSTESVSVLNDLATSMRKEGFDWIDDSYVDKDTGAIGTDSSWHRTDYIDIEDAEIIYLFSTSSSSTQLYNCWYDENKTFISSFLCNKFITEYTPPSYAKYFILSTDKVNTITRGIKESSADAVKWNLGIGKDKPSFTYRGSLSANASYDTQIGIAPKIGFKFGLFASLASAFDDITIQLDAYSPNQIVVDDTNVTLKYRYGSDVVLPHGVTIADDIAVNVLMDNPSTIKVTVASKGVQNTVSGSFSVTAYETLQILNGNQALSNLVITVGCTTVNHDVWVFGDSYLGMTNPARWAYYLNENDFTKNVMLCGSTGSGKDESDIWFNSFLTLGAPKKIVWCMGMNYDSDGSSAPASGWLTQIQNVKGVCDANSIELILTTIPTIPTKNHEQKNAYVRASGLRYIDFAKAVGAQSDGTWYSGMLSSDEVHPTELGAKALFNMAIASVPELTYDYR